jgi:plasmid replication initiation protein
MTEESKQPPPQDGILVPSIPAILHDGRDEMNFAEFPLGIISKRADPSQKTLIFEDKIRDQITGQTINRKLTITGSDAFGLPTSTDDEVLLGLIQFSKLQGFADRKVYFTRYQLIRLLGWSINGQSYERIDQALNRWLGVSLYYDNAWRDKHSKSWMDEKFHILEHVKIDRGENERTKPKPEPGQAAFEFASSSFTWNEVVFKSFEAGNVKALDFAFVMALNSAISRRLYRFLDKRFHKINRLEFDLKTLAYEKIAMSRNTPIGDLKRQIGAAVKELEETGFLKPLTKEERFRKERAGEWRIVLEKMPKGEALQTHQADEQPEIDLPKTAEALSPAGQMLVAAGVTPAKAKKLAEKFSAGLIQEKLEVLSHLVAKNAPQVATNPAGFLIRSIEEGYENPRGFESTSQKKAKEDSKKARLAKAQEAQKQREDLVRAKNEEQENLIAGFWDSFTDKQREACEAEALSQATKFERGLLESGTGAELVKSSLLWKYAKAKLIAKGVKFPE